MLGTGPALRLSDVSKRYGETTALSSVSFEVERGEVAILLGANGAGKTTTTLLLAGLLSPDGGLVQVAEGDPRLPATRRILGVASQVSVFPPTITPRELLRFACAHYTDPLPIAALLEAFSLEDAADHRFAKLSVGYWRRAALSVAFAGRPEIALLDEPTAGLDVHARRRLIQFVREYAREGGTVLMTTHHLNEAHELADRIVFLKNGRVGFDGTGDELTGRGAVTRVSIRAQELPELPPLVRVEAGDEWHRLYTAEPAELLQALLDVGADLRGLEVSGAASLEDAFLELVGA